MVHVFVSPHPDDAALSCGGRIASLRDRGELVAIVTVFSGAGAPGTAVSAAFDITADQSAVVFLGGGYDGWDASAAEEHASLRPPRGVIFNVR